MYGPHCACLTLKPLISGNSGYEGQLWTIYSIHDNIKLFPQMTTQRFVGNNSTKLCIHEHKVETCMETCANNLMQCFARKMRTIE